MSAEEDRGTLQSRLTEMVMRGSDAHYLRWRLETSDRYGRCTSMRRSSGDNEHYVQYSVAAEGAEELS